MAQWDNLGRTATIAQLAGVDALGLISTILQAAQAVRHNRETCQELVQDLQMMEDLLKLLREPEMMRQDEIKNVLNGLDTTLREAGSLVQSCRDCSLAYRIFMGWKQSDQFRRVKKKIAKHLRFYPMISHADITRRLEELGKSVKSSSSSQQDAQETQTSSTSSQNPEARNPVETPVGVEIEPVEIEMTQAGTQSTTVEEHQQAGYNENNGSLPTTKWRFGLKLPLSRKKWLRSAWTKGKVETPSFICELTGLGLTFFDFTELCIATGNFSSRRKIEGWGSDDFYKGVLSNQFVVIIERRPHPYNSESAARFEREVGILAKLRHMNIVKPIGCCTERGEALLVYEYMENLSDVMIGGVPPRTGMFLDWSRRFKIIIGIVRGLLYLHECCGMYIALGSFGPLTPLSILLDSDMAPKITDFAQASNYYPDEHGILHGAMRRCYSDVFRFGLTLLEIITAKSMHELYSGEDYATLTVEGMARKMDPALDGEPQMAEIMRCIHVALLCMGTGYDEEDKHPRPSMWDVLLMLSCESAVIPAVLRPLGESTQRPEASGSGWAHFNDAGELSDSDIVEPR